MRGGPGRNATLETDIELGDCAWRSDVGRYYICCRFTVSHSDVDGFPNASIR